MLTNEEIREILNGELINYSIASNGLNTSNLFHERRHYKENQIGNQEEEVKLLDMWYEYPLYGLINTLAEPVLPREEFLEIFEGNATVYGLNFVVDAFNDMNRYIKKADFFRKTGASQSVYKNLKPILGWSNYNQEYQEYINFHYEAFTEEYLGNFVRNVKVQSFAKFMEHFMSYSAKLSKFYPITLTAYQTSKVTDPHFSGLVIELKDKDHGDDIAKKEQFFDDIVFDFFLLTSKRFGFIVDRNAPWRIVANVRSSAMEEYMAKYDLTFDTLFDKAFKKTRYLCYQLFKEYLIEFYDQFIEDYPTILTDHVDKKEGRTTLVRIDRKRTNIQVSNEEFWLKHYLKIRSMEVNSGWHSNTFDKHAFRLKMIYQKLGLSKALDYIENVLGGFPPIAYKQWRLERIG